MYEISHDKTLTAEEFEERRDNGSLHIHTARNNLVIRDGVVATKDGSDLREYLAECGLYEGAPVNVCHHTPLLATIGLATKYFNEVEARIC